MLGNEGEGLIPAMKKICDYFVYIPQYTNKTASLNVAVAGSIIFHHFSVWADYEQAEMHGEKFQDQKKPLSKQEMFFDCVIHREKGEEGKREGLGEEQD